MNSLFLKENGFSEASPLKGISLANFPQDKSSVFAIIDTTLTGKPTSDILYIGKSKKLTKRIFGGYLAGFGGKTTKRINSKLFADGYIEKAAISWLSSDKPKTTQQELLEKFKKENGNYPVWNTPAKKMPPKKASKKQAQPKAPTKKTKPQAAPKKPST